jgi:Cu/Ag efflux pump CusA
VQGVDRHEILSKSKLVSRSGLALLWVINLQLPIDAVPDITDNQVQIITSAPSLVPLILND